MMGARHDGYVEDSADDREYNNKKTFAGRAAVALDPTSNVRVDLTAWGAGSAHHQGSVADSSRLSSTGTQPCSGVCS